MAPTNYKAPPSLTSSTCYEDWLKEIEIWQAFTDLTDEKQGPADIKEIKARNGVENIIKALNKLCLKEKLQMAYKAYDAFKKFGRPEKMSLKNILMSLNIY